MLNFSINFLFFFFLWTKSERKREKRGGNIKPYRFFITRAIERWNGKSFAISENVLYILPFFVRFVHLNGIFSLLLFISCLSFPTDGLIPFYLMCVASQFELWMCIADSINREHESKRYNLPLVKLHGFSKMAFMCVCVCVFFILCCSCLIISHRSNQHNEHNTQQHLMWNRSAFACFTLWMNLIESKSKSLWFWPRF